MTSKCLLRLKNRIPMICIRISERIGKSKNKKKTMKINAWRKTQWTVANQIGSEIQSVWGICYANSSWNWIVIQNTHGYRKLNLSPRCTSRIRYIFLVLKRNCNPRHRRNAKNYHTTNHLHLIRWQEKCMNQIDWAHRQEIQKLLSQRKEHQWLRHPASIIRKWKHMKN